MKLYEIAYPDENDNDIVEVLTEDEIIASYWEYWSGKMKEIGREAEATRERCIDDWCVIHWAVEVNVPIQPWWTYIPKIQGLHEYKGE